MIGALFTSSAFYTQAAFWMGWAATKAWRGRLTDADLLTGSRGLWRALERVGVQFRITGREHLSPGAGPFVFVANHMSAMETQILPAILEAATPCTFVVKDRLLGYPIFGRVLKRFDPIVVGRTDVRADLARVMEGGTRRLGNGVSVIVFPQARRSRTFDPKDFNGIGARLAWRTGRPLVPIALDTGAWTEGRFLKDIGSIEKRRPVRIAIGEPIRAVSEKGGHRQAIAFIESTLDSWAP